MAANVSWTFLGSSSWTGASNWVGGVPVAGSTAIIAHSDVVSRTVSYTYSGGSIQLSGLLVDNAGSGSNVFSQATNTLNSSSMTIGNAGNGYWVVSDGTFNIAANSQFGASGSGRGTGTFSGGTVNLSTFNLGALGFGTFNQSNGTLAINNNFSVGQSSSGQGTYIISGGSASVTNSFFVGESGNGTVSQSVAKITANSLILANGSVSAGTYSLQSGTLAATQENVGNRGIGRIIQIGGINVIGNGGGTLTVASFSTANGLYSLGGTGSLQAGIEYIGAGGTGSFVQTGGINNVGTTLITGINNGTGNYSLGGTGVLVVANEELAQTGVATFTQSGGTHNVSGGLAISTNGGNGAYYLSDGSLSVLGDATIGLSATGTALMNISAGSMEVAGATNISSVSNSKLQLAGGMLTTGTLNTNGSSTNFQWSSGVLKFSHGLSLSLTGGMQTSIDLTALKTLIVTDTLSGDGSLPLALNGGILSVGDLSNYGLLQFNSGTLQISSAQAVGLGSLFGSTLQLNNNQHVDVVNNTLTVNSGGLMLLAGGSMYASNGVTSNGQIQLSGPTAQLSGGSLTNNGIVSGNGRIANQLNNTSTGIVRASGSNWLQLTGSGNVNNGQLNLINGGAIEFTHDLTNNGVISGRGVLIATGGLTNGGQMQFSGGFTDIHGTVVNNNRIIVTGGSTSTFYDPVDTSGGNITVNTNSTVVFLGDVVGQSNISGPGVKDFEAGASLGPIATVLGSTIVGPLGTVTTPLIHENSLAIYGHTSISAKGMANDPSGTSIVKSLQIVPGGQLDLTNNSMIVDFDGSAGGLLNEIRNDLQTGRLTSSESDAAFRLGYADNSNLGLTSFSGQPVDSSSLLIKYTYAGDADLNGLVNAHDLGLLAHHWQQTGGGLWFGGDFNYDGTVDLYDMILLAMNWQAGVSNPQAAPSFADALGALDFSGVTVPEPTTITSLCAAAMMVGRRRRKSRVE